MSVLCAVTSSVIAIENKQGVPHKTIKELGEEIRDRRNLEYSLNLPHSRVSSFRSLERRITNPPTYDGPPRKVGSLYQGRPTYGTPMNGRASLPAPSYAVQMEPMVQYSQKDPLYDGSSDNIEEIVINRNELQAQPKILSLNERDQIAENDYAENEYASLHGSQYPGNYGPPYASVPYPYYDHPEPIIEIIIKESNETLPPSPIASPLVLPRKKEPIQVFYVKYQKSPHGDGKDVIYDAPIPAITPPSNLENEHHEEESYTISPIETLTHSPPPSTTLRAIIKPDSEDYHSNSGIRITFGNEGRQHHYHEHAQEGSEESAPQVAVALPQQPPQKQIVNHLPPPQFSKRQQVPLREHQQFQSQRIQQTHQQSHQQTQQTHQQAQQRIQFQQPFSQTYQQLPSVNSPNQPFRSQQNQQFIRPTSPVFHNPQIVPQNPPQHAPRGPPQGSTQSLSQGPPRSPPQGPPFSIPQRQPTPNFPPQGPQFSPNSRPPPQFQQRPDFPPSGSQSSHRIPFPIGPQRPHPGPPQQFVFNEHEYLQKNYHTITTEQLEPQIQQIPREQQLPVKSSQNFRETQRKPILPPIPISQEEYNQRYYEQVRLLQQQEQRNRQRPPQNLGAQVPKFQQIPSGKPAQPPKQNSFIQESNQQKINIQQQQIHQQNLRPQPPLPQQPQQFQQDLPGAQFVPPGGELIASIPKYEQHLLIHPSNPGQFQNAQQSQIQYQNLPQPSALTQQRHQQNYNIQQQFSVENNAQSSSSAELISAYEQNQQEIYKLQEKLRKSEQEQQQLLGFKQLPNEGTHLNSNQAGNVKIYNEQYTTLNLHKNSESNKNQGVVIQGRNPQQQEYISQNTNKPPLLTSSTYVPKVSQQSRFVSSTPNSITDEPEVEKKEKSKKPVEYELPDEVPEDLRQQLLSSGILENAQISILDYDKVGDIPIENLPPEQLASFYGAGGGLQISGSERVVNIVKKNGEKVTKSVERDLEVEGASSERLETYVDTNGKKKDVEMKVVHFDPNTIKGQQVAGKYVQDDAKRVDPVALNDQKYNRYLPLKVNGAHFPLPDVPELKGRKVTSVVVLAPVDYDYSKTDKDVGRSERAAPSKGKGVNFVTGDALKRLVKTPTVENYKKWLEKEKSTTPDLQSVVLLVTGSEDDDEKDREIFMYDVSTQTVSKLDGQLSSAFVDVAETNAHSKDFDQIAVAGAGVVESAVKLVEAPTTTTTTKPAAKETKFTNHKATFTEIDAKKTAADKKEKAKTDSLLKVQQGNRSTEVKRITDSLNSRESEEKPVNHVLISSGYSRMKHGRGLRRDE